MPRSIAELLAEGRLISGAREQEAREWKNLQAATALVAWRRFMDKVQDDLGSELLGTADPGLDRNLVPASFIGTDLVRVTMRPFGASTISLSYVFPRHKDDARLVCKTGTNLPEISVEQGCKYSPHLGKIISTNETKVYDLAEAVYLCSLQTDGYREEVAAEAKARPPK